MKIQDNIETHSLKENSFKVPEGYFESLPHLISDRIAQTEMHVPPHAKSLWATFRPQLALAASFVLMIGIGYGIISLITPKSNSSEYLSEDPQLTHLDTYILINEAENYKDTLDSETIITFLTEQGISPASIASLE